jgi:hypothetical protein
MVFFFEIRLHKEELEIKNTCVEGQINNQITHRMLTYKIQLQVVNMCIVMALNSKGD